MTFSFATGEYKVAGSFNLWFKTNIVTNLPTWLASAIVNFDYPDVPLFNEAAGDYAPKFSVTHLGAYEDPAAYSESYLLDGLHTGQKLNSLAEINCWVNVKSSAQGVNTTWQRDLRQMRDMVVTLFSATRQISIVDVYTSTSSPAATGYILRIDGVDEVDTPIPDVNLNVRRKRILVRYCYYQRST